MVEGSWILLDSYGGTVFSSSPLPLYVLPLQ